MEDNLNMLDVQHHQKNCNCRGCEYQKFLKVERSTPEVRSRRRIEVGTSELPHGEFCGCISCCYKISPELTPDYAPILTGGSADYYKVPCVDDDGEKYTAECKHIINAKNMNFNMANVFKANFRMGDKQSTTVEYDLEKMIFFTVEELRRLGFIESNEQAIEAFKRIIGEN